MVAGRPCRPIRRGRDYVVTRFGAPGGLSGAFTDNRDGWAFYDEHVEADAVHEQVVRKGVIATLLADEPALAGDVVFAMQVDALLNGRLADNLLSAWRAGQSSLREPGSQSRSRWLVSQKG